MAVKIYRAKDLCEAFALIRNDFGLNATILETREIQSRKFFGLIRGENLVEVTATDEEFDGARVSVSEKSIRSENHEPFRKQGGMGTGELPESETEENADAVSGEVSENRKKNIFRAAEMRFMEEGDLGRLSEGNEEQRRENASLTDFSELRDISFRESPPRDGTFCAFIQPHFAPRMKKKCFQSAPAESFHLRIKCQIRAWKRVLRILYPA